MNSPKIFLALHRRLQKKNDNSMGGNSFSIKITYLSKWFPNKGLVLYQNPTFLVHKHIYKIYEIQKRSIKAV
jgi:hypothetical protein